MLTPTKIQNEEQNAVQTVIQNVTKQRTALAKQQEECDRFMFARQRAAKEFKHNLFEKAIHAAGMDPEELIQRQKKDAESVMRFIAKQKQTILSQSSLNNRQNELKNKARLQRWQQISSHKLMPTEQSIVLTLDTAAEILLSDEGTTSIGANNNLAFTKAFVSSGGYLGGPITGDLVYVDWLFVWSPPRSGRLDATSFLTMNGTSTLLTNSTCDGGSSSSSINGSMTLHQGNVEDSSSTDIFDSEVSSSWGDSLGAANTIALDETDVVGYRPTQFPVVAETPIVITVSASLYVSVFNGQAELDFMTGDFRLNVPYVFLQLI
ncbi:Uncharacterised protein [Legionella steigerwaltii]|uniref:Uncharacterized protein n=1 Tax=Legionella steigerwaltii TaxID=460 RepID=A0A378L799_9GAMM|nr:hypothetical protein [Legionella steigerwaltii]KTD77416.1 hypothetical protein Lstg_1773 [Legionella steigerwaltii]STY21718.1 Uncharacterised protein [Legionella steigerwaltii]